MIEGTAGELRKWFIKQSSKAPYRDAGMPSFNQINEVITDPELRDLNYGDAGSTIWTPEIGAPVVPTGDLHRTYSDMFAQGGDVSQYEIPIPFELNAPEANRVLGSQLNKAGQPMPRGQRIDAFNKRGPDNVGSYEIATQQRADDINAYIDFVKRGKPLPKALKATLVSAGILTAAQAEAGVLPSVKKLVEAGYPESTAQKIISGELPMDFNSRINRAREQGRTTTAYRVGGTGEDQLGRLEFDPSAGFAQRAGGGVWFSQDAPLTLSYSRPEGASYKSLLDTSNFGQVDAGGQNWNDIYDTDFIFPDGTSIHIDDLPELLASQAPTKEKRIAIRTRGAINTTDKLGRAARDLGLSGVEIAQVRDIGPSGPFMLKNVKETQEGRDWIDDYEMYGGTNYSVQDPSTIRSYYGAAFDPDEVGNPNIMASPAPVGVAGGLLASKAVTPEGQLNPLISIPAEIGSALNEALVGTVDFLVPDTVNAVSELIGSEYRMPRLSDQELVRLYSQGGYMDEGYGRDAIRTATGLLSPL